MSRNLRHTGANHDLTMQKSKLNQHITLTPCRGIKSSIFSQHSRLNLPNNVQVWNLEKYSIYHDELLSPPVHIDSIVSLDPSHLSHHNSFPHDQASNRPSGSAACPHHALINTETFYWSIVLTEMGGNSRVWRVSFHATCTSLCWPRIILSVKSKAF